tara:strand:- start:81 stop:254 length:174 start_codon:yes stop_codon:yes gene_type:complete
MKKIIPYLAFLCMTGFTITNNLPVIAGSCNSHINQKNQVECDKDDKKCQQNNREGVN